MPGPPSRKMRLEQLTAMLKSGLEAACAVQHYVVIAKREHDSPARKFQSPCLGCGREVRVVIYRVAPTPDGHVQAIADAAYYAAANLGKLKV